MESISSRTIQRCSNYRKILDTLPPRLSADCPVPYRCTAAKDCCRVKTHSESAAGKNWIALSNRGIYGSVTVFGGSLRQVFVVVPGGTADCRWFFQRVIE